VIQALAQGMSEQEDYVRELATVNDAEVTTTKEAGKVGANYPFPGVDAFYQTVIRSVPNFSARASYPWANGAPGGTMLFKVLDDNIARAGIPVHFSTRAVRLITGGTDNEVLGVTVDGPSGRRRIKARRGVILACGGFEGDPDFQEQFWEGKPVLHAAARNNTGDGIRMAQDLGAQLWHMWHFHGAYGFRHSDPDYPYAIRVKRLPDWIPRGHGFVARRDETGSIDAAQVKMAWILLDGAGRRYMNEYQPYLQDTAHRQMHLFDPVIQDYPRIPSFLICDENGRKLYPLGRPTSNDKDLRYDWSDDNMREVGNGILKRANSLAALAAEFKVDAAAVEAAVARWNGFCAAGADADFARPPGTMVPIDAPPFYGAPVWPVVSNTQGGPIHNDRQQVIDAYGNAIPRLYTAGELGSAYGHLYMSGGNISECFVTGRIGGREAAALARW
jgi:succinate dehydrogenase/fumarate reductase flavoprotein subunit